LVDNLCIKCNSTEGSQLVVEIRLESHQNHSTMLQ